MDQNAKTVWTKRGKQLLTMMLVAITFAFYMIPFAMILLNSLKSKRDIVKEPLSLLGKNGISLDNFYKSFVKMDFMKALGNSVFVTGVSVILIIILSSMTAYLFSRTNWLLCRVVFALMIFSMVIPFQVLMIPEVSIYGNLLRLLNRRTTLIFMHLGFSVSMSVFMYHGFIKSSVPISLEEAAKIDGATRLQTFFRVVFPLLKPTTATLVILYVLGLWNDFLLPSLVLGKKPLYTLPLATRGFFGTYSSDLGLILAALVMTVIPIIILYIVLQKYIVEGVVAGAVKS
jgi:raffinose/stachyose/melibiose transport system permease protein